MYTHSFRSFNYYLIRSDKLVFSSIIVFSFCKHIFFSEFKRNLLRLLWIHLPIVGQCFHVCIFLCIIFGHVYFMCVFSCCSNATFYTILYLLHFSHCTTAVCDRSLVCQNKLFIKLLYPLEFRWIVTTAAVSRISAACVLVLKNVLM